MVLLAYVKNAQENTAVKHFIEWITKAASECPNVFLHFPFVGNHTYSMLKGIAFDHTDYIELVDWT